MTDQTEARFMAAGLDPDSIREDIEDHLEETDAGVEEHVEGVYAEGAASDPLITVVDGRPETLHADPQE